MAVWTSQREEERSCPVTGGKKLRMGMYADGCGGEGGT